MMLMMLALCPSVARGQMLFEPLGTGNGLAADYVVYILQLKDNRIAAVTLDDVNIWDGKDFRRIRKSREDFTPLPGYRGGYHAYIDKEEGMWIKDYGRLWHYDKDWKQVEQPLPEGCDDVFVDDDGEVYFIQQNPENPMLDLKAVDGCRYEFYADGSLRCFAGRSGKLLYENRLPLADSQVESSLVVTDYQRKKFYQLLNQRFCMVFDLKSRQWSEIFRSERLHTIALAGPNTALITSYDGMWKIDLTNLKAENIGQIKLTDGYYVSSSRLNTVFRDREGRLWLGSYDRGLLRGCPPQARTAWGTAGLWAGGVIVVVGFALLYRRNRLRKAKAGGALLPPEKPAEEKGKERKGKEAQPARHEELMAKARTMVENNLANPEYSVEKLAQDLCMDRTGLYKKMKAATNQSPLEFIKSIRLAHAAQLMKEGNLSMQEIAARSGMGSARHMMQCFKALNKKQERGEGQERKQGE